MKTEAAVRTSEGGRGGSEDSNWNNVWRITVVSNKGRNEVAAGRECASQGGVPPLSGWDMLQLPRSLKGIMQIVFVLKGHM